MVKFLVEIAADLHNLTDLQPHGGCDTASEDFVYQLKFRCDSCGYEFPRIIRSRIRGVFSRCGICDTKWNVVRIPGHGRPFTFENF